MTHELNLPIYLLKKGFLKNRQSTYKAIKKKGAEGWADMFFNEYILKNDITGIQEVMKEAIELDTRLKNGVSLSRILAEKQ